MKPTIIFLSCLWLTLELKDVNAVSKIGETSLILAVKAGDVEKVKTLINMGADINLCDWYGRTPLFHAVSKRIVHTIMIESLVSKGADVNVYDSRGRTPLGLAVKSGRLEPAEILIERGTNVNAVNNRGETPYKIVATCGRRNIAGLWRSEGGMWNSPKEFELCG